MKIIATVLFLQIIAPVDFIILEYFTIIDSPVGLLGNLKMH